MDYVEVLRESRKINVTRTSTESTIVVLFQLNPDTSSSDPDYEVLGDDADAAALEYAYNILPMIRLLPDSEGEPVPLVINSLEVEETNNFGWYKATAKYLFDLNQGQAGGAQPEDEALNFIRINFNVGGRVGKVLTSLTDPDFATATTRPMVNNGRAIGVTEDNIEGTDVLMSGLQLMITVFYFPHIAYSPTVIRNRFMHLCRRTNNGTFLGFSAGELLLTEISGGGTVGEIVPVTFTFDVKENITDQNDAPFPDLSMTGHQVLDYRFYPDHDDNAQAFFQKPEHRFIHTVYKSGDFSLLGIPGATS